MTNIEENRINQLSEFDTLVISGSSIKLFTEMGGVQCAYDEFLLSSITNYIGTSSGSILNFLLSIGYSPVELIVYTLTNPSIFSNLENLNFYSMMNGTGGTTFDSIYEHLERLSILKLGYVPTLLELKKKHDINLVCVTYNRTKKEVEYLSYLTYPELSAIMAVKMSSNLPFVFEECKYGDDYYIDGGIVDNFAIKYAESIGNKILGIYVDESVENTSTIVGEKGVNNENNVFKYFYELIFIPVYYLQEKQVKEATEKSTIIKLETDLLFFDFKIDTKTKLDMFSSGYQQMNVFLKHTIISEENDDEQTTISNDKSQILVELKTNLMTFCDELIAQFPEEGDLIERRIDINDRIDIEDIAEMFSYTLNKNNQKLRGLLKDRNEHFFLEHGFFDAFSNKNKIIKFRKIWRMSLDDENKNIIWKWIDIFVYLVDKYNKQKKT